MPLQLSSCSICNNARWIAVSPGRSRKCTCLVTAEMGFALAKAGINREDSEITLDSFPSASPLRKRVNELLRSLSESFKEKRLPLPVVCFASAAARDIAEDYLRFITKEAIINGLKAHFGPLDHSWDILARRSFREEEMTWDDSARMLQDPHVQCVSLGSELVNKGADHCGKTLLQIFDLRKQANRATFVAIPYVNDETIRVHYGLDLLQYLHNPRKSLFLDLDSDAILPDISFKTISV